jgi:oligosaccharide repeat unit polymerase
MEYTLEQGFLSGSKWISMSTRTNGRYLRKPSDLLTPMQKPTLLLHPLTVFSVVWLGVVFLYSLHLSKILLYTTQEVVKTVLVIWVPFAAVTLAYTFFRHILIHVYPSFRKPSAVDFTGLERKLVVWFRVWIVISIIEIIASGGIPILWLIQHSSKTYVDFGISSLHGLVNSLLLSIGLCRFALFLMTGKRRHLLVPAFIIVWSIAVVTRNMLLVSLIEFAILFFRLKPVKTVTIFKLTAGVVGLILAFGVIGDYRSGSSDLIRLWAQPTEDYPDWLPSGVLWAYIYISTPVNNLVYTSEVAQPINSPAFPNTVATLFPTVIRTVIYGSQLGDAESGQLVASTFNVSTAYIGPFQDYGFAGIALFSMAIAAACQVFWFRRSVGDILIFAVLTQCLVLSLFFNHFFYLPVISQVAWVLFFFRSANKRRISHLSEDSPSL